MNEQSIHTCRSCLRDLRRAELRVWPSGRPVTCCDACMTPRSAALIARIGKRVRAYPARWSMTGRGRP